MGSGRALKLSTVKPVKSGRSRYPAGNAQAAMVQGRVQKHLNEITLLGQPFVKDPDQTVEKLLKAEKAGVSAFHRLEVGEGIEKRADDFVAEVMAQAKGE